MIKIRSEQEINKMRESGLIAASALKKALESVKVGISSQELDKIAAEVIISLGGDFSYRTVPGYRFATCITFNEQVVHGLPSERKVLEGDIVSIDLAVEYKGWNTDTAWSVLVKSQKEKEEFLRVGKEALKSGIKQAIDGNKVGDISAAIQGVVEEAGFHIVRALVGHGVGEKLHEEPEIPGYGSRGRGPILKEGMSLAIEVIYTVGTSDVVLESDHWTYSSADGSMAGLFEMTVIVGKKEAKVLTDWRRV